MDRRTTIKWVLAAASGIPLGGIVRLRAEVGATGGRAESMQYGTDPNLQSFYHPGDLWPLTFTATQKKQASILCDTIIPADASSPSASQVGVVDFLDEWISAPYSLQRQDRVVVLDGLGWLDAEASRRYSSPLLELATDQLHALCDDICYLPKTRPDLLEAAKFFARYRDLTTGGFYTTPPGREDLRYVGNTPLPRFDGPPPEVLRKVGLL
jgi:hypothetical protein